MKVSTVLPGLVQHLTYYFRAVAQNSYGMNRGQILELRPGTTERGATVTLNVSTTGYGAGTITPNPLGNCGTQAVRRTR